MPVYEFKCNNCLDKNNQPIIFSVYISAYKDKSRNEFNDTSTTICPTCGKTTNTRIYYTPSIHMGMTIGQKNAGANKDRIDKTKHLKDERTKRQKQSEPGTREHDSNELWTGTESGKELISSKK